MNSIYAKKYWIWTFHLVVEIQRLPFNLSIVTPIQIHKKRVELAIFLFFLKYKYENGCGTLFFYYIFIFIKKKSMKTYIEV